MAAKVSHCTLELDVASEIKMEFSQDPQETDALPVEPFHVTLSNRGKACLITGGYCYRRGKGVKKGLSWRCTTKSCCGRMVTDHSVSKILAVNPKGHNHIPNPVSMEKKMFKNRLKYIATEEPLLHPEQLLEKEIIAAPPTLSSKELRAVRQSVWRHREQFLRSCGQVKISQATSSGISSLNQMGYDVDRAGNISNEQIRKMTNNGHGKLLEAVKSFIPQLEYGMHKGQAGRVAVIGGCQEYTGAPYFASITALKLGADLSHVFCTVDAATVIKSYSPELIVHPLLDRSDAVAGILEWLPRFHSLIIGPGLGRDEKIIRVVSEVIEKAKEQKLPLVIDADGLFLVTQDPSIISGYTNAVLTPNIAEFSRLYKKVVGRDPDPDTPIVTVTELSRKLGHVTILQKGPHDIITDGENVLVCSETGSPRRCGGQGDLLSGSLGVFLFWALQESIRGQNSTLMDTYGFNMCAAYASSALTRECNRQAFEDFSRSMTTTDMIAKIHSAFEALYM
ncbi:unnamed protein product [Lymnaea stagnalis]|uniref:ATP-dependent (S)-NAD(P)H-hydrate dehydratase n=1 Tax=Lymnaea stagnalis TaxID=6523 RepID=A0AAV2HK79_LYMST